MRSGEPKQLRSASLASLHRTTAKHNMTQRAGERKTEEEANETERLEPPGCGLSGLSGEGSAVVLCFDGLQVRSLRSAA